jgi:hypothetical protein
MAELYTTKPIFSWSYETVPCKFSRRCCYGAWPTPAQSACGRWAASWPSCTPLNPFFLDPMRLSLKCKFSCRCCYGARPTPAQSACGRWAASWPSCTPWNPLLLILWDYPLSVNSLAGAVTKHGLLQPYRRVGGGLHHGRAVHQAPPLPRLLGDWSDLQGLLHLRQGVNSSVLLYFLPNAVIRIRIQSLPIRIGFRDRIRPVWHKS